MAEVRGNSGLDSELCIFFGLATVLSLMGCQSQAVQQRVEVEGNSQAAQEVRSDLNYLPLETEYSDISEDRRTVEFFDDFLGTGLNEQWSVVEPQIGGGLRISESPSVNGWVCLEVTGEDDHPVRLRLGEGSDDGPSSVKNFHTKSPVIAETRVFIDTPSPTEFPEATVGFIGVNDPDNIPGALLIRPQGLYLETAAVGSYGDGEGSSRDSSNSEVSRARFFPQSGIPFTIRIEAKESSTALVINGEEQAVNELGVSAQPALFEFQLWSKDKNPYRLCADYLSLQGERF